MSEMPPDSAMTGADGASCTVPSGGDRGSRRPGVGGLLSGGCCSEDTMSVESRAPMGRTARWSRALAGVGFLVVAGALGTRRLPGRIALWPTSVVPTWFGISHLVAGVTGYHGCPEIGAIPSVMLGREVKTNCELWQSIDSRVDPAAPIATPCC
jgi:hypothetical protein